MPEKNFFSTLIVFIAMLNCSVPVHAERQSLASIILQAEGFLADYPFASPYPVDIRLGQLDKRLNLKPCHKNLDISFTRADRKIGNTSLTLKCRSPVNWQIHLPVSIGVYQDVIVNKTPLLKGQEIGSDQIEYRKKDISRLNRGFFVELDALQELQAKRNLPAGSILNPGNLIQRQLVQSGQKVTIILNLKGLQIKTNGLALQSAGRGQLVKVRNIQSNRIVEGRVSGSGQITVTL